MDRERQVKVGESVAESAAGTSHYGTALQAGRSWA
jgi:hypothetical protein